MSTFIVKYTAKKVSGFGVILVRVFPHSDWIWRDTNQNNSEYGRFSPSGEQSLVNSDRQNLRIASFVFTHDRNTKSTEIFPFFTIFEKLFEQMIYIGSFSICAQNNLLRIDTNMCPIDAKNYWIHVVFLKSHISWPTKYFYYLLSYTYFFL